MTKGQKQKQIHFPSILSKLTTALTEQSQQGLPGEECLLQRTSRGLFLGAQLAACFPLSRTSLQFLLELGFSWLCDTWIYDVLFNKTSSSIPCLQQPQQKCAFLEMDCTTM